MVLGWMLFSLLISTAFIKLRQTKGLLVSAVLLYFAGVLLKAYSNTPLGFSVEFNTRNGPFFSTLHFVTGYLMSGIEVSRNGLCGVLYCFWSVVPYTR